MCFSAIASYAPRPVQADNGTTDFDDSVWRQKIDDPNLFRPQVDEVGQGDHQHHHDNGSSTKTAVDSAVQAAVAAAGVTTIQSTIITLPDGRRMMLTPLD
jgi:hypothetical protein